MNLQIFVNALVNAALIAPPAMAFSLLFGVLKFPNFAIGGYITVGAFAAYTFNVPLGLPLPLATLGAMLFTGFVVWLAHVWVFKPMQDQSAVTLLVVSIALTLILESVVRLFFSADVRGFDIPLERPWKFWGARITREQVEIIACAVVLATGLHVLLRHTRTGRAMRAVADNPMLAAIRGVDAAKITALTTVLCGAIFGLTGVFAGLDLVIEPLVGWNLTIPIFAAAILGGIGSPYGAILGALLLGLAEELTILVLPSTYKIAVGFVIIAIFLLLRPQGLFGTAEIKK
ncbi:branched-chain amino acid ABC transporter permease [Granulosicoccus sp. 3-233]|uniref:branched-chain amino acid ABC transporter permease n=1 Tax=Granulosicoccus sp. 3-233 TaxID=3417969 RepID=UPI003D35655D